MTALARALLAELRAAGGEIIVTGPGRLRVRAPAPLPGELMQRLRAHKPELLAALARPQPEPERVGWDALDWRAFFDERAGIMEFDGHRSRADAERLAWGECLVEWHKAHGKPPPRSLCAGCDRPLSGAAIMDIWDGARVHDVAGYACLISYGRRWRAAAAAALAALGIPPPQADRGGAADG